MDGLSASMASSVPFATSSSPQPGQNTSRGLSRSEDVCPIPGLPANILHMRVKEGSKIRNLLRFATARMLGGLGDSSGTLVRQVVFTGSGRAITKTVTCVEILKRTVLGLHQLSKLYYKSSQQGAPGLSAERTVPAVCILLSKDPLDPREPGYQPPQTVPTEDAERRRDLLRTAGSRSSRHTDKRFCLNDRTSCPPKTSEA